MTTFYTSGHSLVSPIIVRRQQVSDEASYQANSTSQKMGFAILFAPGSQSLPEDAVGFNGGVYTPPTDPVTGVQLPARYAVLASDNSLICMDYDVRRDPGNLDLFHVTANWRQPDKKSAYEGKPAGTDVKWNVDLDFGTTKQNEPLTRDLSATPVAIVNSAKQPFDSEVSEPIIGGKFTLIYTTDQPDITTIEGCLNRTNTDVVHIVWNGIDRSYPIGTLVLDDQDVGSFFEEGNHYWKVTLSFLTRTNSITVNTPAGSTTGYLEWKRFILDQGTMKLDATTGKPVPILDINNVPISIPVPLNGSGQTINVLTTAPVYLPFTTHYTAAFAGLFTGTGVV